MNDDKKYPIQPAQDLLARLAHTVAPNKRRVEEEAEVLLSKLKDLGRQSGPISMKMDGPLRVQVMLPEELDPPRSLKRPVATVFLNEDSGAIQVEVEGRPIALVPVAYDVVARAFVPTPEAHRRAGREVTALEAVIQAAWNELTPTTGDFYFA